MATATINHTATTALSVLWLRLLPVLSLLVAMAGVTGLAARSPEERLVTRIDMKNPRAGARVWCHCGELTT
jgi:hypothetical protein